MVEGHFWWLSKKSIFEQGEMGRTIELMQEGEEAAGTITIADNALSYLVHAIG